MQKIIEAEKSDLFDVLAHVVYATPPITREERAADAVADLGKPDEIGRVFAGFQKYLYQEVAAA